MRAVAVTESVYRLCYAWGPPLAALSLAGLALYVRWKQGRRGLGELLSDRLVFAACLLSALGVPVFYRYWGVPPGFAQGEIGILVGEIPGDGDRTAQQAYARAIREQAAAAGLAGVVKVRLVRRPLPTGPPEQFRVAASIARRLGASFILRCLGAGQRRECRLAAVNRPRPLPSPTRSEGSGRRQPRELDEFLLPGDTALGARFVAAMCLYRRGDYREAADRLRAILAAEALPADSPARPYVAFVLGNCDYRLAGGESALRRAIRAYEIAARGWSSGDHAVQRAAAAANRAAACARLARRSKGADAGRVTGIGQTARRR